MAMKRISKISLEYLSTAFFGCSALVLSLLTGLFAGVNAATVIVRALIIMALFAIIGFGIGIVLKKYVPELYDLLISFFAGAGAREMTEEHTASPAQPQEDAAVPDVMIDGTEPGEEPALPKAAEGGAPFKEMDKEYMAHYSTGAGVNTKEGKLGKHILAQEKLVKYEPKVMAQAVRTMMSNE